MAYYLGFYLVPKKYKTIFKDIVNEETDNKETETIEEEIELTQEPLNICYFCGSSDIFEIYKREMHPVYSVTEYTDLKYEDAKRIVETYEREYIKPCKDRLDDLSDLLKLTSDTKLYEDFIMAKAELRDRKIVLEKLKSIANIVYDVYLNDTDFEKVKININ